MLWSTGPGMVYGDGDAEDGVREGQRDKGCGSGERAGRQWAPHKKRDRGEDGVGQMSEGEETGGRGGRRRFAPVSRTHAGGEGKSPAERSCWTQAQSALEPQ